MKTRVNLYTQELQGQYQLIHLPFLLTLASALLLVLLAWYVGLARQEAGLEHRLKLVNQEQQSLDQQLKSLSKLLSERHEDAQLAATQSELQQKLQGRKALMQELAGQDGLKSRGFSDLMLALADNTNDDIWLTRILLNGQQLRLEGGVLHSDSLPNWLTQLGASDYLRGKEFATARIYRDSQDELQFVLSAEPESVKPSKGAQHGK